jgi:two-component system, NtrC family, response regulator GlrR
MSPPVLIGDSAAHRALLEQLARMASTPAEMLISGPSGVGKELYARYVHESSPRSRFDFVAVNCGALPNELIENELFGHIHGAFTGARTRSEGLVCAAEGGTLFLDEIDALSLASQVKLLRFIQYKEYRRLGETRTRRANVRIIAATNTDLVGAVREGSFREDLFFRLRVIPIEVPALRNRPEDIPPLLAEYAEHYSRRYDIPRVSLSPAARERLYRYHWPGNIRELENCIHYLTCLQLNRVIEERDLPLLADEPVDTEAETGLIGSRLRDGSFRDAKRELVDRFERAYLESMLRQSNGNIAAAARNSNKPRRVFFELMRKHGLRGSDYAPTLSVARGTTGKD